MARKIKAPKKHQGVARTRDSYQRRAGAARDSHAPTREARVRFCVFGGELKGMRLEWRQDKLTRPTKAIVKESFFNTLGSEIAGSVFIEGFAGCGSMGIEALSHGAHEAVFYECDREAYAILLRNVENAKKRKPELKFRAYNADFFAQGLQACADSTRRAIMYLDPPFSIREGMGDVYERLFALIGDLRLEALRFIVFEYWSEYNMPPTLGAYTLLKTRRFGKSSLAYYAKTHTKD